MKRIKAAVKTVLMIKWFTINSYNYVTNKSLSSKIEFVCGYLPALYVFMGLTYDDFLSGELLKDDT